MLLCKWYSCLGIGCMIPKISAYTTKRHLSEAIERVMNRTLRPFEVIIVDGCFTNGSQT